MTSPYHFYFIFVPKILYLLIGDSPQASTLILEVNKLCPYNQRMIPLKPLDDAIILRATADDDIKRESYFLSSFPISPGLGGQ
jgi:hypothetical protein